MNKGREELELNTLLVLDSDEWQNFLLRLATSEDLVRFLKPLTEQQLLGIYEDSRK